jgi:hypothetical protein
MLKDQRPLVLSLALAATVLAGAAAVPLAANSGTLAFTSLSQKGSEAANSQPLDLTDRPVASNLDYFLKI